MLCICYSHKHTCIILPCCSLLISFPWIHSIQAALTAEEHGTWWCRHSINSDPWQCEAKNRANVHHLSCYLLSFGWLYVKHDPISMVWWCCYPDLSRLLWIISLHAHPPTPHPAIFPFEHVIPMYGGGTSFSQVTQILRIASSLEGGPLQWSEDPLYIHVATMPQSFKLL